MASPRLERLQWWFKVVEEVVVKMWPRWIRRRCCMHGERAWQRHIAMATVALLRARVGDKASKSESGK